METPIELITTRLNEIAIAYKNAWNNDCSVEEVDKLEEIYNQYYYCLQLIGAYTQIPCRFYRMRLTRNDKKVTYVRTDIKRHLAQMAHKYRKINKVKLETKLKKTA